jgi:hypothetical protein
MNILTVRAGARIMLAFLSLSVAAIQATATVIYNNLGVTSGGGSALLPPNGPQANSFSTSTAATLTDVELMMLANNPADGGSFTVSLLSDSSTAPGTLLDTIAVVADSSLTTSFADYDYVLTSPVALTSSTRYWIEASQAAGTAVWSFDATNGGVGVASEFNLFSGSVVANSALTPNQMEVNVAPEPASWTLMIAFGIVAAFCHLRRRERRLWS